MIKEAVILAGGYGTRLQSVVKDVPKPMASVKNRPFLEYLFHYLKQYNISKVVLSVGYKSEIIKEHFKTNFEGIDIDYAFENEPLGTGGGIINALKLCVEEDVLILNGDTFFNVDLFNLNTFHQERSSKVTLCLKHLANSSRYGQVNINEKKVITGFIEKKNDSIEGDINGGIYLVKKSILENIDLPNKFSFEKDFFETYYSTLNFYGFISNAYFIDIGVPEDYQKAQIEIDSIINKN